MNRAFTLLEILLATAMLALIAMASTSLVQTASRARAACEAPLRWQAAAERTLELIAADVRRSDLGAVPESVVALDGELRLASRSQLTAGAGPAEIVYRLDSDGRLHREPYPLARQLGARGEPAASSVVLGDLIAFVPQRDEDRSSLVIRLTRREGQAATRIELRRTVRLP